MLYIHVSTIHQSDEGALYQREVCRIGIAEDNNPSKLLWDVLTGYYTSKCPVLIEIQEEDLMPRMYNLMPRKDI